MTGGEVTLGSYRLGSGHKVSQEDVSSIPLHGIYASTVHGQKCILTCDIRVAGVKKRKAVVTFYKNKDGDKFSEVGHDLAKRIRARRGTTYGQAVKMALELRGRLRGET